MSSNDILRNTQRTNTGQVPACSQEPVDFTDTKLWTLQLVWRQYRTGSCSALPLSVQNSYRYENILQIREVSGHRIDAKIFPKAPPEKAQTTMSENTYTFPKIDVFWMAILLLLVPTGNNKRASFLVHQVPHTSATVLLFCRMFAQFSLHVWVSKYTCRPMIANLLYIYAHNTNKCLPRQVAKLNKTVGSIPTYWVVISLGHTFLLTSLRRKDRKGWY